MNQPFEFRPFERSAIAQDIGARFEEQVARAPERLAAKFGASVSTYAQLNAIANQVAHAILRARGDVAEPVAIVVEQGIELLGATLGALKAGKLYVPIEACQPRKRFAALLSDARAPLAVASTAALPLLHELAPGLRIIDLGTLDPSLPRVNPALRIAPDAGACIYYTTGTTGAPKGVVDSHRNVLHNVMRYTNGLRVTADDRLTLLQSPSFSGAVSSMFTALLNGAASFPFDVRGSSATALADYVEREGITIYHSVPAIFRSFLRGQRRFPSVRIIRLEGDQAAAVDVELYRRHFDEHCMLVNGLGTTETGIVRRYFVPRDTTFERGIVPVGHAIEDMEVEIVDDDGRPLPAGVTGEIVVRSRYLALGYWQRSDLTERAFQPITHDPSRRSYRTGDLGRMRPDGCLEHLGRKDSRTRIRGVAVDLADVEDALYRLPVIDQAAVDVRPDERGETRLVAYYVAAAGCAPTISAIRRALADTLPPPMIPTWFEPLHALALNENLKVDRAALPDRSHGRPCLDVGYVPAQDPTQARIVSLWESLLAVSPIGIRDDFFDLGGDSLLAARMIEVVSETFDIEIPLAIMTGASTVEHVAASAASRVTAAEVVALRAEGTKPRFYFLHGDYVGGGVYCRELAKAFDPERPFFALTPCGLDGTRPPPTIEDMAERHLGALRRHQPRGPYLIGGSCNGGWIALKMARRLVDAGERVERLVVFRASARNARHGVLRLWSERIGRRLACAPETQRTVVRRLRWFLEAWSERTATQRMQLLMRKVRDAWRRAREKPKRDEAGPVPGDVAATGVDRAALVDVYMLAAADHIPLPYAGRVDLMWPAVDDEPADEALAQWRRIAPAVRMHVVPGDHLTALTVHARAFAIRLAERLADDPPAARDDVGKSYMPGTLPAERGIVRN